MPCEPRRPCWRPTTRKPPGAFGQHFAKTGVIDPKFHRWLLDSYDDRIRGDYDTECVIEEESASLRIEQAKEFLQTARQWLEAQA